MTIFFRDSTQSRTYIPCPSACTLSRDVTLKRQYTICEYERNLFKYVCFTLRLINIYIAYLQTDINWWDLEYGKFLPTSFLFFFCQNYFIFWLWTSLPRFYQPFQQREKLTSFLRNLIQNNLLDLTMRNQVDGTWKTHRLPLG